MPDRIVYRRQLDISCVGDEQDSDERARMRRISPDRPLVCYKNRYKMCGYYPVGFQVAKLKLLLAGEHTQGRWDAGMDKLRQLARRIPCREYWEGFN